RHGFASEKGRGIRTGHTEDVFMKSSVDSAVLHVLLNITLGFGGPNVCLLMCPQVSKIDPKKPLPDHVSFVEPHSPISPQQSTSLSDC
uniref:Uncharacterized protein n=1 Tax=Amphilophus citrinellus TaxID=61819 RepID=A0A3Q0T2V0_AMPCI